MPPPNSSSPKPWALEGKFLRTMESAIRQAASVADSRTHVKLAVAGPGGKLYRVVVYEMLDVERVASERAALSN